MMQDDVVRLKHMLDAVKEVLNSPKIKLESIWIITACGARPSLGCWN